MLPNITGIDPAERNKIICLLSLAAFIMILTLVPSMAWCDDPEARAIMEKADARDDGDNTTANMELILIDKDKGERIRKIRSFRKDKGDDQWKLMFFMEPADVKDTAFLSYDFHDPDKDDDQWLYLPALRKTKRIASSDKSSAFMGSDFSYADMTRWAVNNYSYRLLKEITVRGHQAWLIECTPRNKRIVDQYGYLKSVRIVRKDNYVVVREIHWLNDGQRLKYMDITKLELIDGIWQPLEIQMTTKKAKRTLHKTIMRFENVKFNQGLEESFFTVRQMEKGL